MIIGKNVGKNIRWYSYAMIKYYTKAFIWFNPVSKLYLVKAEGLPNQVMASWQEFTLSTDKGMGDKEMTGGL